MHTPGPDMAAARRTLSGTTRIVWRPDPGVLACFQRTSIAGADIVAEAQVGFTCKAKPM
jgi:hypothetical protein